MANMTDHELEKLLALATQPQPPEGAAGRAIARALSTPSDQGNVVAFTPRPAPRKSAGGWLAALPLAASLAFGIYLGVMGSGGYVLPSGLGGSAITEEDTVVSGVEDMESLADEDVS